MMKRVTPYFASLLLLAIAGCTSVPETLQEKGIERISQLPNSARAKIQISLKKSFAVVGAPEVHRYLSQVALRLLKPLDKNLSPKIQMVSSNEQESPKLWIIPPDMGFVDQRILKSLEFENEIAALLAFNWERTQDIEFEKRFIAELDQVSPDFRKIYQFSENEDLKAVEGAVDILYNAGYDPRGLISVFNRKTSVNKDRSVVLQDKARRTIAFYKPLINPTVRSQEFYQMRKKLDRL
jgi:hypothetical protein